MFGGVFSLLWKIKSCLILKTWIVQPGKNVLAQNDRLPALLRECFAATVWDSTLWSLVGYLKPASYSCISHLQPSLKTGRTADNCSVNVHIHEFSDAFTYSTAADGNRRWMLRAGRLSWFSCCVHQISLWRFVHLFKLLSKWTEFS